MLLAKWNYSFNPLLPDMLLQKIITIEIILQERVAGEHGRAAEPGNVCFVQRVITHS